jgi:hypothetical protein
MKFLRGPRDSQGKALAAEAGDGQINIFQLGG